MGEAEVGVDGLNPFALIAIKIFSPEVLRLQNGLIRGNVWLIQSICFLRTKHGYPLTFTTLTRQH